MIGNSLQFEFGFGCFFVSYFKNTSFHSFLFFLVLEFTYFEQLFELWTVSVCHGTLSSTYFGDL
jgi:hypothetical protein